MELSITVNKNTLLTYEEPWILENFQNKQESKTQQTGRNKFILSLGIETGGKKVH